MTLTIGEKVPDFSGAVTNDSDFSMTAQQGKFTLLYFYPKDNTPGCTEEGQDFRDRYLEFSAKNVEIFGISRDSLKTHQNFKLKHNFPFELISDKEETICNLFDVIKEKKLYGKTHMGIERSSFLIDPNGILIKEWRKVKVKTHIEEVLDFINGL